MPIAASPGLPCNSDSCAQKKDYSEFLCLLRGIHKIPHSYLLLKKELTISGATGKELDVKSAISLAMWSDKLCQSMCLLLPT